MNRLLFTVFVLCLASMHSYNLAAMEMVTEEIASVQKGPAQKAAGSPPNIHEKNSASEKSMTVQMFTHKMLNKYFPERIMQQEAENICIRQFNQEFLREHLIYPRPAMPNVANYLKHNKKNNCNATILHDAARIGDVSIMRQTLSNFDINSINENGETPLMIAALHNHTQMVIFLLSLNNVEVDAQNKWGNTALHYAARLGHASIVQALLSHTKINPNISNHMHKTALMLTEVLTETSAQGLSLPPVEYGELEIILALYDGITLEQRKQGQAESARLLRAYIKQ